MSALVCQRSKHKNKTYVCPHCVHPFTTQPAFENHLSDCSKHVYQVTKYPDPGKNILKWQSRERTERLPFVIYADFDSCLVSIDDDSDIVNEHLPSGFCSYTVTSDPEYETEPFLYSGSDCMNVFFDHLANEQQRVASIRNKNYKMLPLTNDEQERFDRTQRCPNCPEQFSKENKKVMLHNHWNGKFIDALCNKCNMQIRNKKDEFYIPVIFHNLKNYDAHHIFRYFNRQIADNFGKDGLNSVKIIALNLERYISFEIQHLRFIDSYQFLNASLEKLVKSLTRNLFHHITKHLGSNDLLFAKGIFPYEWFDSLEKFDDTQLPPQEAFYSELNDAGITDDEYKRIRNVWNTFECHSSKIIVTST
jgi:hypothetical protein